MDSSAYSSDQNPGNLLYIRIMLPSYIGISALLSRKCWSVLQLVSRALRSKVKNPLIFRDYFISHYEDSFINESTNQYFLKCHSRVWPSLFEAKFVVSSPGLLLRFDNIPHGELLNMFPPCRLMVYFRSPPSPQKNHRKSVPVVKRWLMLKF